MKSVPPRHHSSTYGAVNPFMMQIPPNTVTQCVRILNKLHAVTIADIRGLYEYRTFLLNFSKRYVKEHRHAHPAFSSYEVTIAQIYMPLWATQT